MSKISDERLLNTRAWASARIGQLSGAEVIVSAIDELRDYRKAVREYLSAVDALRDGLDGEPKAAEATLRALQERT